MHPPKRCRLRCECLELPEASKRQSSESHRVALRSQDCWLDLRAQLVGPALENTWNFEPVHQGRDYLGAMDHTCKNDLEISETLFHCVVKFPPAILVWKKHDPIWPKRPNQAISFRRTVPLPLRFVEFHHDLVQFFLFRILPCFSSLQYMFVTYIRTCKYTYLYIYRYMYIYIYAYINIRTYMCVYAYMCVVCNCICKYVHVYHVMYEFINACCCICKCACTSMRILCICANLFLFSFYL